MKSIIEELWYGNVDPNIKCREATQEAKELMNRIADGYDQLQAMLTDKQKEILEKFHDCYTELGEINATVK